LSTQHVPTPELWSVLEAAPVGGVVEGHFSAPELRMGLARARLNPAKVPVFDAVPDATKRDVTGLALRVRAAYA
jgi:ribosomal-protein-alanine N-acetyltransferase